jgi:GAF domain-containing protein
VIDNEPHAWSYDEVRMLQELAACVMHEIDLRTQLRDAAERLKRLENVAH